MGYIWGLYGWGAPFEGSRFLLFWNLEDSLSKTSVLQIGCSFSIRMFPRIIDAICFLGQSYPVSFCRSKKSSVARKKSPVSNYGGELSRSLKRSGVGIMPLSERLRAKCFQVKSNGCSSVTGLLPASCLFCIEGTVWYQCRLAWTSFLQWTVWPPFRVLRIVLKRILFF